MTRRSGQPEHLSPFEPESAWLEAALGGGLPEPTRSRWQPLRVGIVGLWEYDYTEFWFADGRLVLRGGNGAGKTKVLELTTLMLLRGEITATVLDPFGSQHRSMRFNLLPTGEGDDPRAPADSGLGYAWVEFGRRDEEGAAQFFVCGMGASARRGTGTSAVHTWHFLARQRPGKDFGFLTGGRIIEEKELKKITGITSPGSATAYRARLAEDLFGLPSESYDNLLELLKQLRRPKLGERLNPAMLADTLRAALPAVSSHEITQLAEGWDVLEQLRRAVEQTEEAAMEVARFVRGGWRPWARVVLRRRADEFTTATTTLDNTTRDWNKAQTTLVQARTAVTSAQGQLTDARRDRTDRATELRELLDSASYQDAVAAAERVESLRREEEGLQQQLGAANERLARETRALEETRRQAERRAADVGATEAKVRESAVALGSAAAPAGLVGSVERHLPARDLDALMADHASRAERLAHLLQLRAEHDSAEQRAERSANSVENAEQAISVTHEDEERARGNVADRADALSEQMRDWSRTAKVARCPVHVAESWCDLIPNISAIDDESGSVSRGNSPIEAMRAHVQAVRERLNRRIEQVRMLRQPLQTRCDEVDEELVEARARGGAAPPRPEIWARRDRPGLEEATGAPLWCLVNPALHVTEGQLARLEAALAASGLLDAWLAPDGQLSTRGGELVADVQVSATGDGPESSLLTVLKPDSAGGVPVAVVRAVLASIGWCETVASDDISNWLAADGSWRMGGLIGRAEPVAPASYIGAAAREAARQRDIARLESELSELVSRIRVCDEELVELSAARELLDHETRRIPAAAERTLTTAVATLAERIRRRHQAQAVLERAQQEHTVDLTRQDEAWARYAEYAGAHGFALQDLLGQAAALQEFRSWLGVLSGDLDLLRARQGFLDSVTETQDRQERDHLALAAETAGLEAERRQAGVRLDTARSALGGDSKAQLARRTELDDDLVRLDYRIEEWLEMLSRSRESAARAEETLNGHEKKRADADRDRDTAMSRLWAAVDGGLTEPVGLAPPGRRSVQSARELAATVRREFTVAARAADEERAWRRCYQQMEELRQKLLPNRDARVVDMPEDKDMTDVQRIAVLSDPTSGWQSPHHAADALADQVREQRDHYDAEQQRVLTTLLGSTFIEHLKERVDYATRTFAGINDRLARHPTRHGHVVRVDWEADPVDPDAGAVVKALGLGYDELSPQRQEMVRSFLAHKIEEARSGAAAEGGADWKEQLAQALDYRGWLRLSLRHRLGSTGAWVPFDTARHGAKSGGEKVVLLSQPLFAAAVVAYDAAGPDAPRWVWLDEAMTGVDAEIKASFMGLTVDFELDVMLTAHDEWCKYPEVPAVAIYDLARQQHLPGVDAMPYLWCGGVMTPVPVDRLGIAPQDEEPLADGRFGVDDDA